MNIDITEEQRQQMWENLIKEAKEEVINIPPNAKTKKQFMEETGMTEWQAKRFLEAKVTSKELLVIKYKNLYYYYPA